MIFREAEQEEQDPEATILFEELVGYVKQAEVPDLPIETVSLFLQRIKEIREIAENPTNPHNVDQWLKVFELAERITLYFLAHFASNLLPTEAEIKKTSSSVKEERSEIVKHIGRDFPYSIRVTQNPHLYLSALRQIDIVYGKGQVSTEEDWQHEMGHYAHRLAVDKPITEQPDFLAFIYRYKDWRRKTCVGFHPAIFQDETDLTPEEQLFITAADLDDLSEGDIKDMIELGVTKPPRSLPQKIRAVFKR